ncbi:hypothetical protein [Sphingomonas sp. Y38-1Y]|uniref:hypothetical protein n=1 Tax=Sphingomonas sp. Y38-1Y TaxID=3078265 RepID=UPI0028E5AF84|nr:hypothetical protein [Sphingomonas sp. Y38-1Y]
MTEPAAPAGPAPTIFEAIVRKACVTATYNRTEVLLAPHAIWTRHGDMFVDAVTVRLNGQPPREVKLGTFKLIGLNDIARTEEPFEVSELFNPLDDKYGGEVVFAVER